MSPKFGKATSAEAPISFTCHGAPRCIASTDFADANRHCYAATPAKAGAYGWIGPGLRREDKEVLPGLSQPSCVIPFLRRHTNVVPRLTPIRGVPWSGAS